MGGKSDSADQSAARAQLEQAKLARQLVDEVQPLRRGLIDDSAQFLAGNFDVTGLPQFAAGKDVLESQFGRARDAVIGSTPEGGGLTTALAELERDRASALTQVTGGLAQDQANLAAQMATFGTAAGSQGLGTAAAIAGQRAAAEAQQNAAKAGGTGRAAGAIAASAITKNPAPAAGAGKKLGDGYAQSW